jgi:predicted nucleic acid-binding protein
MSPANRQAGTIVCNAGPLIALAGVQQLAVLEGLYLRVLIAEAVFRELTASKRFAGATTSFDLPWLEQRRLSAAPDPLLRSELGEGEAETIALALQVKAERVLIDERKGRRVASLVYALKVIGTGGILLAARQAGLVKEIRPLMQQMRANGYFLSVRLVEGICQAAGE